MRKLSVLVVAAMLLSTGSLLANDGKKGKTKKASKTEVKSLSTQIGKLLNYNNFTEDEAGETAQVLFTLNSEKEIVVLSVDTDDATMDAFIKNRLNYQEVDVDAYEDGKKYTVSVRIDS